MAYLSRREFTSSAVLLSAMAPTRLIAATAYSTVINGQTFQGTRPPGGIGDIGGTAITATSNTLVENCHFSNFGDGAVCLLDQAIDNFAMKDCDGDNLYCFINNLSWTAPTRNVPLTNFTFSRITGTNIERNMIRIGATSSHGLVQDVVGRGNGNCANYCAGFQTADNARDIAYKRCEAHNFAEARRSKTTYWNGDGFSDERTNSLIRYYGCLAAGCTDGGFDTKSAGVYMADCRSSGNKRNFRLWNTGSLIRCTSEEPVKLGGTGEAAHFSFFGGSGPVYIFDSPVVRASANNTAPVFLFMSTTKASIGIYNADIDAPGAPLIKVIGPEPSIHWYPDRSQQKIRVATLRA